MKCFYNIFYSPKITPITNSGLDVNLEKTITIKQEKLSLILPSDLEDKSYSLKEQYIIPSPTSSILPFLSPNKKIIDTSFYSSYKYPILYKYIYKKLLPYNPYFDSYEYYWLIVNKTYKKHTSIKISLYNFDEHKILVECHSMDKDDKFWKIYHLLKKKCNNVKKEKLMEFCESNFDEI